MWQKKIWAILWLLSGRKMIHVFQIFLTRKSENCVTHFYAALLSQILIEPHFGKQLKLKDIWAMSSPALQTERQNSLPILYCKRSDRLNRRRQRHRSELWLGHSKLMFKSNSPFAALVVQLELLPWWNMNSAHVSWFTDCNSRTILHLSTLILTVFKENNSHNMVRPTPWISFLQTKTYIKITSIYLTKAPPSTHCSVRFVEG